MARRWKAFAVAGLAAALVGAPVLVNAATTNNVATCTANPTITPGTSSDSFRVTCSVPKPVAGTVTQTVTAPPQTVTATVTASPTTTARPGLRFAPSSFFYANVQSAPLDPASASLISHLNTEVTGRYNGVAALNVYDYNVAYYVAAPGTPRTTVRFNDCQGKGYLDPNLAAAFAGIPIPAGAVPAAGTDHNLTVYEPSTGTLWELWLAQQDATGWSACYGGRIDSVPTSPGYFPNLLGQAASGISMAGGMISLAEVKAGVINHAMYLAVPDVRAGVSWPAQRSDGNGTDPTWLVEGTRLRLDPSVDVATLNLTPLGRMVAKAAQTYGFVVADRAGAVAVITESGAPAAAANGGLNPWDALLGLNTTPAYNQLAGFPWDRMQALPKDWGKP